MMALVLAIEPDGRQAAILKQLVRDQVPADLVVSASKDGALAQVAKRIPDLVLVSALMSPSEEAELTAHLRGLEDAQHLQTLTIPLLASKETPVSGKRKLLGGLKRGRSTQKLEGCAPAVFAEEIRGYLQRAREIREQHAHDQTPPEPLAGPAVDAQPVQEPDQPPVSEALDDLTNGLSPRTHEDAAPIQPIQTTTVLLPEVAAWEPVPVPVDLLIAPPDGAVAPDASGPDEEVRPVLESRDIQLPECPRVELQLQDVEPVGVIVATEDAVEQDPEPIERPTMLLAEEVAGPIELAPSSLPPVSEVVEPVERLLAPGDLSVESAADLTAAMVPMNVEAIDLQSIKFQLITDDAGDADVMEHTDRESVPLDRVVAPRPIPDSRYPIPDPIIENEPGEWAAVSIDLQSINLELITEEEDAAVAPQESALGSWESENHDSAAVASDAWASVPIDLLAVPPVGAMAAAAEPEAPDPPEMYLQPGDEFLRQKIKCSAVDLADTIPVPVDRGIESRTPNPESRQRAPEAPGTTSRSRDDWGTPLALWVHCEVPEPESPVATTHLQALLGGLLIAADVAAVAYPSGCRIRDVHVPPARHLSVSDKRTIIVSRRLLRKLRRESRAIR